MVGKNTLQIFCCMFGGGGGGAALLLWGGVVGAAASAQAILYLSPDSHRTFALFFSSLTRAGCGACVLIGFLTPVASRSLAILSLGNALSWLPPLTGNLFDSSLAALEMICMAT